MTILCSDWLYLEQLPVLPSILFSPAYLEHNTLTSETLSSIVLLVSLLF